MVKVLFFTDACRFVFRLLRWDKSKEYNWDFEISGLHYLEIVNRTL